MADAHVIDIVVQTVDKTSAGLSRAEQRLRAFDKSVQKTTSRLKRISSEEYAVTLKAIDNISPTLGRAARSLGSFAGRGYNASLRLIDKTMAGVQEARARLTALTSKAWNVTIGVKNKVTGGINSAMQSMTGFSGQMLAGAGIGYGLYDTVQTYKNFEAQMSAVGSIATSGMDKDEAKAAMERLTAKAKEMGATTAFSATQAGKAFEYMAMAGWKTEEMMDGIGAVMHLAAASGEDLGRVSDIVTDALTAFGLKAKDASHFADVLAQTAMNANTNVGLMGTSFQYVAPTAGSLGYNIEDVSLALGVLANSSIKGEKAGTSLMAVLNGLASPSKEAGTWMDRIGLSMFDASGKAKPLREVMYNLRESFANLTQEEKLQAAHAIAGVDGMKAMQIIANTSAEDFEKLATAIDHADGAALRAEEIKLDNLSGDLTLLSSAWESLQLQIMEGSGAADGFRGIVKGLTKEVERIQGYIKDGFDFGDVFKIAGDGVIALKDKFLALDGVGSVLAGGLLIGGLMKIVRTSKKAMDSIKEMANASIGGGNASTGGSSPMTSKMTISANQVIVNGKSVMDGGDTPDIADAGSNSPSKKGKPTRGARIKAGVKGFGSMAIPLELAMGAYDYYSTSEENGKLMESADWNIDERQRVLDAKIAAGEDTTGAQQELDDAYAYKERLSKQNADRESASIGSTAGSVIGGIAGAALGSLVGPAGTVVGGMAGSALGGYVGNFIGANWTDTKEWAANGIANNAEYIGNGISNNVEYAKNGIANNVEWASNGISSAASAVSDTVSSGAKAVGDFFSPAVEAVEDGINIVVGLFAVIGGAFMEYFGQPIIDTVDNTVEYWTSIWGEVSSWFNDNVVMPLQELIVAWRDYIVETVSEAWDAVCAVWGIVSAWFGDNVWNPICEVASAAWDMIMAAINAAYDFVCSLWEAAVGVFDSVWSSISGAAETCTSVISGAFESAWSIVQGIWGKVAGWFEENVIGPVKEKFNKLREIGSSITGLGGSGGGSEEKRANGGMVFSPRHALIGEAGPEAIIPLSASRRNVAMDILNKVESYLGIGEGSASLGDVMSAQAQIADTDPFSDEGDTNIPIIGSTGHSNAPTQNNGDSSTTVTVNLGGVSLSVDINGSDSNPDAIVQAIRANMEDLADEMANKMGEKIGAIFNNQPVMV